jgi:hypothetical protein
MPATGRIEEVPGRDFRIRNRKLSTGRGEQLAIA